MQKIILSIIIFPLILGIILLLGSNKSQAGILDEFAQCLTNKKIAMYGADWCPHCQNEKKGFGNSFQYVTYVECSKDPNQCLLAGVTGFPTWIFSDGKKLAGEQGIQKLSQESQCPLPNLKE